MRVSDTWTFGGTFHYFWILDDNHEVIVSTLLFLGSSSTLQANIRFYKYHKVDKSSYESWL